MYGSVIAHAQVHQYEGHGQPPTDLESRHRQVQDRVQEQRRLEESEKARIYGGTIPASDDCGGAPPRVFGHILQPTRMASADIVIGGGDYGRSQAAADRAPLQGRGYQQQPPPPQQQQQQQPLPQWQQPWGGGGGGPNGHPAGAGFGHGAGPQRYVSADSVHGYGDPRYARSAAGPGGYLGGQAYGGAPRQPPVPPPGYAGGGGGGGYYLHGGEEPLGAAPRGRDSSPRPSASLGRGRDSSPRPTDPFPRDANPRRDASPRPLLPPPPSPGHRELRPSRGSMSVGRPYPAAREASSSSSWAPPPFSSAERGVRPEPPVGLSAGQEQRPVGGRRVRRRLRVAASRERREQGGRAGAERHGRHPQPLGP